MNKFEKMIAAKSTVFELLHKYRKGVTFNIIKEYTSKKVVHYLNRNVKKILLIFVHGLGDTIMFLPVVDDLRNKYKHIVIDLLLANGQENFFGSIKDEKGLALRYDYIFEITFPWVCNRTIKKGQYSAIHEIGTKIGNDLSKINPVESPIVLLHFHSTSSPDINNCDYETAKKIWNEIIDMGKIPMECHFVHNNHDTINTKYDFIDNNVRNVKSEIKTLVGLIYSSYAFMGVPSGPLCVAAAINKNNTACLQLMNDINCYIHMDNVIDIKNYKSGEVHRWLSSLQNNPGRKI